MTERLLLDHQRVESISNQVELVNNASKILAYRFQPFLIDVTRNPATLLDAMAKIGGLLILLKVGLVLGLVHEIVFERRLMKAFGRGMKETFSYQQFMDIKDGLDAMQKDSMLEISARA